MRFTQSLDRLDLPNGLTNDAEVLDIAKACAIAEGIVRDGGAK